MGDVTPLEIGSFAIIRLLRDGPVESIYLGKQQGRAKNYSTIHVFHTPLADDEEKAAFLMRAKALKKLKHRNIGESLDYGLLLEDGQSTARGYLVTEYISEKSILERFPPGEPVMPDEVKRALSPIADALQYAHASHIYHHHLHPGSIFVDESKQYLLTGFAPLPSLCYLDDPDALPYMAPEMLQGHPGPASDQYSLGVMVYEWLCGQRPYSATDRATLLQQQQSEPLPAPRSLNSAISPAVEQVLLTSLARNPEERYPRPLAFSSEYLRALMGFSTPAKPSLYTASTSPAPVSGKAPAATETNDITTGKKDATKKGIQKTETGKPGAKEPVERKTETSKTDSQEPEGTDAAVGTRFIASAPQARNDGATSVRNDGAPQTRNDGAASDSVPGSPPAFQDEVEDQPQPAQAQEERPQPKRFSTGSISWLGDIVTQDLRHDGILSERLAGYEERAAQIEMAQVVAKALIEEKHAVLEASTGTGKALDVDTPIPTPSGWKRMGDLVAGDYVFDERGCPTCVTAAFDVMYDHKCYEVVFSDGSTLIADAEHEWASYTATDRVWQKRPRSGIYQSKNFITADSLLLLEQTLSLSTDDNAVSVYEAVKLIGGHQWSVFQAARQIEPVNVNTVGPRYPQRQLLAAVRDRLAKDLVEQHRDKRAYTIVTTEEMAATLTVNSAPRANHAIAVAGPLKLPDADLPIAPYFLGVWLGDGSSRSNQITAADPDLIIEIEKDGYTVRSLISHPYLYAVDDENGKARSRWQPGMTGRLRALGLLLNKHIPAIYLRSSERQRRALLAGLLDTDGTVSRTGAIEYTTTSEQLAQGAFELACSLGFRATLRSGRAKYKQKDCGPKWTLSFTTDEQVFKLPRKANAHQTRLRNYTPERNRFRYVTAVREVPTRPVRCIQVDSQSHLYLAGRSMIPTHNSLAYLLPIVRSGRGAIISTANKALQEQLFYKDIPFVQKNVQDFDVERSGFGATWS